jgi:hypothetical protein
VSGGQGDLGGRVEGAQGAGDPAGGVPVWVAGREREYGPGRGAVGGGAGVCGYDDQRAGGNDESAGEGGGLEGVGSVGGLEEGGEGGGEGESWRSRSSSRSIA